MKKLLGICVAVAMAACMATSVSAQGKKMTKKPAMATKGKMVKSKKMTKSVKGKKMTKSAKGKMAKSKAPKMKATKMTAKMKKGK